MIGALMFAGLVAGCGGGMEDVGEEATLSATPSENPADVNALACTNNSVHYAQYFYENGVECGLRYYFCDGREATRGCQTETYTQYYYCGCP
ncbi:hypothetical protein D7W81_35210 [Corallococcus aberystwythensis]|uniref:Uncharacterized protein n=2 Tax=Corallococcus aberystwythensis TaxID=2316722 RepID=A0A3A8PQE2_9BACT|nr:hypothetical protein D7W81_35210 [Corallococcus aberystwythensis]